MNLEIKKNGYRNNKTMNLSFQQSNGKKKKIELEPT